MKNRSVARLMYAHLVDMGGLPVRQPLPTQQVQQIDPFLLLHHANINVPTDRDIRHAGVGPHPHRGFSPVTFIFKGGVHHRDSRGNDGVIYAGGAQWMNAGMGIIHSERPPIDIHERGGEQEIIQLWINMPAERKMEQPQYFPVQAADAPSLNTGDEKVRGRIFSGSLLGTTGPINAYQDVAAATFECDTGGMIKFSVPTSHNTLMYLLDGKVRIEGFGQVEGLHIVHFKNDGDFISLEAQAPTRILFLSGLPLAEPVVSYGPFVMSTQTQIMEAMRDYQMGKMGVLIED
ncbi:MAG: pirin family protein [Flammeovirgaceae bacterium]